MPLTYVWQRVLQSRSQRNSTRKDARSHDQSRARNSTTTGRFSTDKHGRSREAGDWGYPSGIGSTTISKSSSQTNLTPTPAQYKAIEVSQPHPNGGVSRRTAKFVSFR